MNIPTMRINKQEFYWCKKNSNSSYNAPVRLLANIMPTNSDGDIVAYGTSYPEYLRIKGDLNTELGLISEEDKIFFRKAIPSTHDVTQTTKTSANFFISARPIQSMSTVEITMKRIPDR